MWLLDVFITPFGYPQVSAWRRTPRVKSKAEYSGKSLGLGSQVSQITAVSYPNALDHYIKQTLGVRWYGRYMDDGYMLFADKKQAAAVLKKIVAFCCSLGIVVNPRKTRICKIDRWFRYLKVNHRLTATGKIERHISRDSVTRERRKLKKFAKFVAAGGMTLADAAQAYASWKGYALRRGAHLSVKRMDEMFLALFGIAPPRCKLRKL